MESPLRESDQVIDIGITFVRAVKNLTGEAFTSCVLCPARISPGRSSSPGGRRAVNVRSEREDDQRLYRERRRDVCRRGSMSITC